MEVVTKGYQRARRYTGGTSRNVARAARKARNRVIRADRRAAAVALHIGEYERAFVPAVTLTEYHW